MTKSRPTIFGLMLLVLVAALGFAAILGASIRDFLPLLALALGAYLVLTVVIPFGSNIIRFHKTYRLPLDPEYLPVDLLGSGVPEEVRESCRSATRDLGQLGFAHVGSYTPSEQRERVSAFVAIFRNGVTWEVARMLGTVVTVGPVRKVSITVLVSTEFEDGCEVVTTDQSTPSAFPPFGPPLHAFKFPDVDDMGELLGLHRALVPRFEGGRTRRDPIPGDPIDYQIRQSSRLPGHALACGYLRPVDGSATLRSTWKGAILIPLRSHGLGKAILLALRRRQARRLLRELRRSE